MTRKWFIHRGAQLDLTGSILVNSAVWIFIMLTITIASERLIRRRETRK